jgi:hypothetical protein
VKPLLLTLAALTLTACHAPQTQRRVLKDDVTPITLPAYTYYGLPGRTYTISVSPRLDDPTWVEVWRGVMPDSMETNLPDLNPLVPQSPTLFLLRKLIPE